MHKKQPNILYILSNCNDDAAFVKRKDSIKHWHLKMFIEYKLLRNTSSARPRYHRDNIGEDEEEEDGNQHNEETGPPIGNILISRIFSANFYSIN